MTDAPERIWLEDERPIGGACHVYSEPIEGVMKYATAYVRADAVDRMVAEAVEKERERCAKIAEAEAMLWNNRANNTDDDDDDFRLGTIFGSEMMAGHIAVAIRKGET